jgi:hypothetical protein
MIFAAVKNPKIISYSYEMKLYSIIQSKNFIHGTVQTWNAATLETNPRFKE